MIIITRWGESMKRIAILGSTGSIGCQTLDIVMRNDDIQVMGLTAHTNIDLLEQQIHAVHPKVVAVMDKDKAAILKNRVGNQVQVLAGLDGLIEVAAFEGVDLVVTAVVGMIGIQPTVSAIKAGKDIALANKEALVTAGELIMNLVEQYQVQLLPVDSEHSAIFQCLNGENSRQINKVILTGSGGPFRGMKERDFSNITVEQALKHPTYSMGKKISIDSATLMNKGLEVIEASWLFHLKPSEIDVIIHPQSIIHSMIEFIDGSVMAQMGLPNMKVPIQYALFYPDRKPNSCKRLNLAEMSQLTFEEPDVTSFRCLQLAYHALEIGGTLPTVLNAANEYAVSKFLKQQLDFKNIPKIIEYAMERHKVTPITDVQNVLDTEKWTYELIESRW